MKIAIASSHEFGRAVVNGVQDALQEVAGCLHALVQPPVEESRAQLGSRVDNLKDRRHQFEHLITTPSMTHIDDDDGVLASADILMVAGWPRLISGSCLSSLKRSGCVVIGYHPSPLPIGRGMSPVSNTLRSELLRSNVSSFELEETADSGALVGQEWFDLSQDDHAAQVYGNAIIAHRNLARRVTAQFSTGELPFISQVGDTVIWKRTQRADRTLSVDLTVDEISNRIRAYSYPYDPCLLTYHDRTYDVIGCCAKGKVSGVIIQEYSTISLDAHDGVIELFVVLNGKIDNSAKRGYVLNRKLRSAVPEGIFDRRYAGVVLVLPDKRIVLQQRDKTPGIINPGGITLFGGGVEDGETFEDAAIRELVEELEVEFGHQEISLIGYTHKVEPDGSVTLCGMFKAHLDTLDCLVQHEGAGLYVGTASEIELHAKVSEVCKTTVRTI